MGVGRQQKAPEGRRDSDGHAIRQQKIEWKRCGRFYGPQCRTTFHGNQQGQSLEALIGEQGDNQSWSIANPSPPPPW